MIIEGRTITTLAEMLEFCEAAVARTHADPSTIRLHVPQDIARRRDPPGRSMTCWSHPPAERQVPAPARVPPQRSSVPSMIGAFTSTT